MQHEHAWAEKGSIKVRIVQPFICEPYRSFTRLKTLFRQRLVRFLAQKTPLQKNNTITRPEIGDTIDPPYFQGIFSNFSEIPSSGHNPFDQKPWIETVEFRLKKLLLRNQSAKPSVDRHLWSFVTLVSNLCVQRQRVRILDFGGGAGDNFVQIFAALPDDLKSKCEYHIVDTPKNCECGRKLLKEFEPSLFFYPADPRHGTEYDEHMKRKNSCDIVLLCGTLQYIENWQELLSELSDAGAEYLYITRTTFNDSVPTFYTLQFIVPDIGSWAGKFLGDIGVAVINPGEIVKLLDKKGYKIITDVLPYAFRETCGGFPDSYRQVFYNNMVFRKKRQVQLSMRERAAQ